MPSVHSQFMVVVYYEYLLRIHLRGVMYAHIETPDAPINFVKCSRTTVEIGMPAQTLKKHERWEVRAKGPEFESSQGAWEQQVGYYNLLI